MQISVDGQGISVTKAMRELLDKKLRKVLSHVDNIESIHIILKVNNHEQFATASVAVPKKVISAHATSDDMYKTIDLLIHNLNTRLVKNKEKEKEHRS